MTRITEYTQKVVVIGAGFGGLSLVKSLQSQKHIKVVVIDKTNHHLFQPLLYQVATAALSPGDIAMPIREIFRGKEQIETILGTVVNIDKKDKSVMLEDGFKISYDVLVVAAGSRHAYFGKNEWEKYAPGLKTLKDAIHIRENILSSFELAERTENAMLQNQYLTFVIVGAGPTGIEMAGAIAEIAHQSLKKNFRNFDLKQTKIILLEGSKQLLAGYPERFAKKAQCDLESMGVTVKLNTRVTEITQEGVFCGEEFYATNNIIWAAGNEASPLLKNLDTPLDKQNRVIVENDLTIKDHPEIFVIGDASCSFGKNLTPLPAVAPVAVQQGRYVGNILKRKLTKDARKPFRYNDKGMMATIGKYKALVLSGPLQCSGILAWFAWCFVHIYFLIGYRTKVFVFSQWVFYFFKGQRNVRLIINGIKGLKTKAIPNENCDKSNRSENEKLD